MQWPDMLSEREVLLIGEALRAVTKGRWITHREFGTRLGIPLADAAPIATSWPAVPVDELVARGVRSALVEVAFGIRFAPGERAAWLTGDPDEYEALIERLDALLPLVD